PNTDLYVYINTTGQPAFRLPIREAWNYREEMALVETRERLELIDKSGQVFYDTADEKLSKLPCFAIVSSRSNGLIGVNLREEKDHRNKQGIIFVNKQNKRSLALIEEINLYTGIRDQEFIPFSNGRAFVHNMYHGWGMINLRGDFIVKPQMQWDPVSGFYNGLAKIKYRNEDSYVIDVRYINRDGKIVFVE
ncbi:MAG: WG repeat-containing protein, partial [Firmicutes bacterium]|nr:WG repeat-containing protein [Bacillota bacterium]